MRFASIAAGATLALAPLSSWAQDAGQLCEDDVNVGPNRVYIQAADTQVSILQALAKKLQSQTTPIHIIYSPSGSCSNIAYLLNNVFTPNATGGGTFYMGTGSDGGLQALNCTPPADAGVDLAISIVFPDLNDCPTDNLDGGVPSGFGSTQGPVQAMLFAVPGGVGTTLGSTQSTITAEEAYLVMGLGAEDAGVSPWSDRNYIIGRTPTKGTQISVGANIQVPAAKWQLTTANKIDQSKAVAAAIEAHTSDGNAEKTLGILGAEIYDLNGTRNLLHSLAFRAFKQNHSYWPDTSPNSFDKANVRDGHYPLWSYVQYLYPTTAGGKAANPNAQEIVDLLVGNAVTTSPAFEPLDLVIAAGLVPACAMKVKRTVEGGGQSLSTSAQPCGCYFDAKVPSGSTTCTPCTTTCTTGTCRHGYCEAN